MFSMEKTAQAAAYLLRKYGGRLNCNKLIKLMYLGDKETMKETCSAITGDEYYALDDGPVLGILSALIKGDGEGKAQGYWDALFKTEGDELVALKPDIPIDWLSECETYMLDAVDSRFHEMSCEELSEWTHDPANCPEWKKPDGEKLPITKADVLKALGCNDEQIAFILEEDAFFEAEELYFASLEP